MGDGIGPEVMAEAGRVIDAASSCRHRVVRCIRCFGGDAIDKHETLPSQTRRP
jgi:isocitrate/isopropylmalate dehydrogenase